MREVGTAVGWTLWEEEGRYYVRLEQVIAFLSNSGAARQVLTLMLADSLEQDGQDVDE